MDNWCILMFRYEIVDSLNPELRNLRENLENVLLAELDHGLRKYFSTIAKKANPIVLIGLPYSPVHFFLALMIIEGYYDRKNNTIYVVFHPKKLSMFLRILTHELTHAYFYHLLSNDKLEVFSNEKKDHPNEMAKELIFLADEVAAYYAPLKYGTNADLTPQMIDLVEVFSRYIFEDTNYHISYVYAPRTLAYIIYNETKYDASTLVEILAENPKRLLSIGLEISHNESRRAFFSALYSALPRQRDKLIKIFRLDPQSFEKGPAEQVWEGIREEEIDQQTIKLMIGMVALSKLAEIRGEDYVREHYKAIISILESKEYLSSRIRLILRFPREFIRIVESLLPGVEDALKEIDIEEYLESLFSWSKLDPYV